jgi:hypothetical protein
MAAGECQGCHWTGNRKGSNKTMNCFGWPRIEVGTAPFPKAEEYQKLKVGAYDQEEESVSEIDLYATDSASEGGDSESEKEGEREDEEKETSDDELQEEFSEYESEVEEPVIPENNWWDDY